MYGYYFDAFVLDELIFSITDTCNFRCRTCFYASTMDTRKANGSHELSLGEIKKISSSIGSIKNLLISGGEPFLRDDLPEICEIFYQQNNICHIHLPSNGFYTHKIINYTRAILNKCPNIHLTIGLSLDGHQTTHEMIKNVKGCFDNTVETAKSLADLKNEFDNLELYIITVVTNTNMNEIINLGEFVKNNLPVDGHGPSPLRGIPYDKTVSAPLYKDWHEFAMKFIPYHYYWAKKNNAIKSLSFIATNRIRYLYGVYTRVLKGRKLPFKCQAGNTIGVLEPNGDVKFCELDDAIGNVRSTNYDFKKIWLSGKANNKRKQTRQCSCTHACFLTPSIARSLPASVKSFFCFTMAKP